LPNAHLASFDYGGHFVTVRDAVTAEIASFIGQIGR
jgi:hypothetical protein